MAHDFKAFPELSNGQMAVYYFDSPHKQIAEDFDAHVTKVIDGDTIRVTMSDRDFDFPVRLIKIAAPELKEDGGRESQQWLESELLDQDVQVIINPRKRVGKWGRILGEVMFAGIDMGKASMDLGYSIPFGTGGEGEIPDFFGKDK